MLAILLSLLLPCTQQQETTLTQNFENDSDGSSFFIPEENNIFYEGRKFYDENNTFYEENNTFYEENNTLTFQVLPPWYIFQSFYPLLSTNEKTCADTPTTDPRCGCDPECAKYGDCCPDSIYFKAEEQKLGATIASCYTKFEKHFYVIGRCPSAWEDLHTRYLCENPDPTYPNPMLDTLVTSLRTNVTYRNSYCASCHNDLHKDIFTWPLEVLCAFNPSKFQELNTLQYFQRMFYDGSTSEWYFDLSDLELIQCVTCTLSLIGAGKSYTINCPSPSPVTFPNGTKTLCQLRQKWDNHMLLEERLRYCEDSISWCAPYWNDANEKELCEAYTAHVYTCDGTYRNYHCALCNYEVYDTECYIPRRDLDSHHMHQSFSNMIHIRSPQCDNDGIYDALSHTCVEVLLHQRGMSKENGSCTNVSFSKGEYLLAEDNDTVFLPSRKATYYQHEFYIQDDVVVLCLPTKAVKQFSPELGYITTAGLSLSIICILLHLTVLCLQPEKLNLPAMNLASLCVSLLLLYSSFIASGSCYPKTTSCTVIAIITHYGLIASFFWMLIISFDICNMTRQTQTKLVSSKGLQIGRFIMYSTIGWLTPAIVTGSAVILDYVVPTSSFAPAYGKQRCWLNRSNALLLFCLTPLIVIMSLNVIFVIWTSHLIRKMRHSIKRPAAKTNFSLNIRLFIITGLTWITGICAAAADTEVLWYLFVVLNTMQGAFIFIAFSSKKKIRQVLQSVFKKGNNTSIITKSTHATSESKSTQ